MHDTSELEIRGIPSVYVATHEFADAGEAQARSLGFPHTPVYVEHPIQDRTDDEVVGIAERAFENVVSQLVKPR